MIIAVLIVLGLCVGSFINAFIWRMHESEAVKSKLESLNKKAANKNKAAKFTSELKALSITKGRSMCPDCRHNLSASDLVPLFSWLGLRGRCRYCHKPISWQYPLVELLTAVLFVISYLVWLQDFNTAGVFNFVTWLIVLIGFIILLVYDLRWMLLPNKITYPLAAFSLLITLVNILVFDGGIKLLINSILSTIVASGIFYAMFQLSKGKWIGGGDVKLGLTIGLILGSPMQSFLVLFLASLIGTAIILPGLLSKKLQATSHIPFGPFLIVATIIVKLSGAAIISWYRQKFLLY